VSLKNPTHGRVYSIQHYVIKFVIGDSSSINKTDHYDITEILLKVAFKSKVENDRKWHIGTIVVYYRISHNVMNMAEILLMLVLNTNQREYHMIFYVM
jgi:hypothetical protein